MDLTQQCDGILALCPPDAAEALASSVAALGYSGLYCDANAINPSSAARIAEIISAGGGSYVDGSVISFSGLRLYLAGPNAGLFKSAFFCAADAAAIVGDGDMTSLHDAGSRGAMPSGELQVIDMGTSSLVAASSLKAVYSGFDKATTALALATHAAASSHGVSAWLAAEAALSSPAFAQRTASVLPSVAGKAWRFVGEMEQDREMMVELGLPPGFHAAAADVYARLARHKGAAAGSVSLQEMISSVMRPASLCGDGDPSCLTTAGSGGNTGGAGTVGGVMSLQPCPRPEDVTVSFSPADLCAWAAAGEAACAPAAVLATFPEPMRRCVTATATAAAAEAAAVDEAAEKAGGASASGTGTALDAPMVAVLFEQETPTAASAAARLGVGLRCVINSLLFEVRGGSGCGGGDDGRGGRKAVLVCAPGDRRVDVAKLAAALGVGRNRVKSASAAAVLEVTGFEPGGVGPAGFLQPPYASFVDERCFGAAAAPQAAAPSAESGPPKADAEGRAADASAPAAPAPRPEDPPLVWCGAGVKRGMLRLSAAALLRATRGVRADLSVEPAVEPVSAPPASVESQNARSRLLSRRRREG